MYVNPIKRLEKVEGIFGVLAYTIIVQTIHSKGIRIRELRSIHKRLQESYEKVTPDIRKVYLVEVNMYHLIKNIIPISSTFPYLVGEDLVVMADGQAIAVALRLVMNAIQGCIEYMKANGLNGKVLSEYVVEMFLRENSLDKGLIQRLKNELDPYASS